VKLLLSGQRHKMYDGDEEIPFFIRVRVSSFYHWRMVVPTKFIGEIVIPTFSVGEIEIPTSFVGEIVIPTSFVGVIVISPSFVGVIAKWAFLVGVIAISPLYCYSFKFRSPTNTQESHLVDMFCKPLTVNVTSRKPN
jgi:hypothetical protein